MATKQVTLFLARSTKGTHVYTERTDVPRRLQTFPTVYVQQERLPDPAPPELKVTLEWADEAPKG